MKILVAVKHVVDYNVRMRVDAATHDLKTEGVKMGINPFDEIALEAAVRLKKAGKATEVVAVTLGPKSAEPTLRRALAMGADRAKHVLCDSILEPVSIAKIFAKIAKDEAVDLVLMGKQATDNDAFQVPQALSALLDWPVATAANTVELEGDVLTVVRETDEGLMRLKTTLPAVVSADLRLAEPHYVALPAMMRARKMPIEEIPVESLGIGTERRTEVLSYEETPARTGGVELKDVDALIDVLKNKLKLI